MVIYKITNQINGKIYIGQTTKTIEQRLKKHISEAKCEANRKRTNNYFHNAINKYGAENFTIELLDTADTIEELFSKEDYWIKKTQSNNKDIGYNLMLGGQSGKKDERTKSKLSQHQLKNWQDEKIASKMRKGLENATQKWIAISKEKQIDCICQNCGKIFRLPLNEAKKRKYCSHKCADEINIKKATEKAKAKNIERSQEYHKIVYKDIVIWSKNNIDLIMNCPYNQISTRLSPLYNFINKKYDISDWRTISNIVCSNTSSSKKKMLDELKLIAKRYAVPDQN